MQVYDKTLKLTGTSIRIMGLTLGGVDMVFHDFHGDNGRMYFSFKLKDLPDAYNFYRILGNAISALQPGLIDPLPDGDPSEVDAMKVLYEADRLLKGGV